MVPYAAPTQTRHLTSACSGPGPLRSGVPSALHFRLAGRAAEAQVRWTDGTSSNTTWRSGLAVLQVE
jgi:hypothetical protein